jgi:predicted transcriptional regulator
MQTKPMKTPVKCDEAIKCVFDLNTLDIRVYKKLKLIGPSRANELAKQLNRERSTIYRSLQKLTKANICKKSTKTLPQGGYYHVYQCCSIEKIQKEAKNCLDAWYSELKKTLELLKG